MPNLLAGLFTHRPRLKVCEKKLKDAYGVGGLARSAETSEDVASFHTN